MEKENIKSPTPEQIERWKKQYKTVHKLTVEDKVAYLHNPDRLTLSLVMNKMAKGDIIGGTENLLANSWLGGDEAIKTDDEYFMGAVAKVGDIISMKNAELEKL